MSDSSTHLDTIAESDVSKATKVNSLMDAASPNMLFGRRASTTSVLTWGYYGGKYRKADGTVLTVANGTVALTDAATNYILETDGVVSKVTAAPAGWPGPLAAGANALYAVVCSGGAAASYTDYRIPGLGGAISVVAADVAITDAGTYYTGTDVEAALQEIGADLALLTAAADVDTDVVYTSDTGSTADSDPGAGLFKWNHATQSSATALYVDDVTTAAVNMTTFFAALPPDGFIHLVQDDDATKWQLWKWSGLPTAGAGYYKFTGLTLMANGGSIADAKSTSISFKGTVPSTYPAPAGFFFPGAQTTASQLMFVIPAPAGITTITYLAAIAGSSGKALTAATAQTDIDVRKNATTAANGSSVGTIRFAAAGTVPTFIAASGFTLTGGTDWLSGWGPATPDSTLADISATLYGTK
jgi:hypothetical protein